MTDDGHRIFREAVETPDDKIDLARAALAIAQSEYPALRAETYLARLDQLAATASDRSAGENSPYRLIASINYVLFTEEGYRGNHDDYYDPRNSFLNEVIERRKGIPITLSVLYIEVARRVGLEVHGVGFPGHFLVKYVGQGEEIAIDPFDRGEVRTVAELQQILDGLYGDKVAFRPEFLSPVSNRQILHRILNNLKAIYLRREDFLKALSVAERLVILEPTSAPEIRDRGLLNLKLECFQQALDDLEAYLSLAPGAEDADEIGEQILALKKAAVRLH
jgi:regulator of sirC expression with transglutaminase-like and TPR domain